MSNEQVTTNTDGISVILANFQSFEGKFPEQAIKDALESKEKITPHLYEFLERTLVDLAKPTDIEAISDESWYSLTFALFLLSTFREKASFPKIIQLCQHEPEVVDWLLGDIITEDLHRILGSTFDGNLKLLRELIENKNADEFVRNAGIKALVLLYKNHTLTRQELLDYFAELFEALKDDDSYVINGLIGCCCDIFPGELYSEIKAASERHDIDPISIDLPWVDRIMAGGQEEALSKLKQDNHYTLIDDPIKDLESWACFRGKPEESESNIFYSRAKSNIFYNGSEPYISPNKGIGRNDPCLCGSGKKYKKCCLC